MKKIFFAVLIELFLVCKVSTSLAQEPPVFSQFFMNPFIYNPAYAGVEGHSVFFLMYRQQWANIDGAPAIYHGSFHTPLPNGIGVGGSVFRETQGLLDNSGIKGAASYLINFDRTHYLRFGMSLGVGTSMINFDQLDDPTDPAFVNLVSDEVYAIGEFGATYHTGHFNFGFALPSLFSQEITNEDDFTPVRVKPLDRALIKANYRGHISDDFAIEPHLIYRYSKNSADQFEIATILHIKHIVWAGASYRQDAGMIGLIVAKIKEKIGFGYAYEMGKPDIADLTGNTHEIHIGFHLGTKKAHADHVSSFIKSHRLTAEERAAKAEEERLAALEALQAEETEESEPLAEEETTTTEIAPDEPSLINTQNGVVVSELTEEETAELEAAKEDNKEAWVYSKPEANQAMTRINEDGIAETAIVLQRINENGEKETVIDFIPAPAPGEKETWRIADPNTPPDERTNADGDKEIGMTWIKTDAEGNETEVTKWSQIYTGEVDISRLVDEIEGLQVASYNDTPVLKIEERLLPDEKVEELRIELDNTQETKQQFESAPEVEVQDRLPEESNIEQPSSVITDQSTDTDPRQIAKVKRGSHMLELEAAYHVIAGAFSSFDNAEKYSDQLFQRGFKEVKVGYVSERGYYYVVISSHQIAEQGINERNRIRRNPTYRDVWLLNVEL